MIFVTKVLALRASRSTLAITESCPVSPKTPFYLFLHHGMKGTRGSVSDVEGSAGLDGHLDNFTINDFAWKDVTVTRVGSVKKGNPKSIISDVDGVARTGRQMPSR